MATVAILGEFALLLATGHPGLILLDTSLLSPGLVIRDPSDALAILASLVASRLDNSVALTKSFVFS